MELKAFRFLGAFHILTRLCSDDPLHCAASQCSISHGTHMQGCCTLPYIWQHWHIGSG